MMKFREVQDPTTWSVKLISPMKAEYRCVDLDHDCHQVFIGDGCTGCWMQENTIEFCPYLPSTRIIQ